MATCPYTREHRPHPCALCAAQRLVTYSEEVAFNDPPAGGTERLILNQHLRRLLTHSRLSAFQRFIQGVRSRSAFQYKSQAVFLFR